jgi:hypothetical protein
MGREVLPHASPTSVGDSEDHVEVGQHLALRPRPHDHFDEQVSDLGR